MLPTPWIPNNYPPTRRSERVDIYKSATQGEVKVPDPYNWFEEYSEERDRWLDVQESFTRSYLDKNPDRQRLETAFYGVNDYARVLFSTTEILSKIVVHTVSRSLHQHCMTTTGGIGFITVAWSLGRVSTV
jgi:Prolyl oligopeptidase, N-terminal beta-propeller domain